MVNIHPEVGHRRFEQITRIMDDVSNIDKVVLCGDFNTIRKRLPIDDQWKLNEPNDFTNWSGKEIDFIMLRGLGLGAVSSRVWYTAASDHIPVIMDVPWKHSI